MIQCPLSECLRWTSCSFFYGPRRRHRRLRHSFPHIEQSINDKGWQECAHRLSRLRRRELLVAQIAAESLADNAELFPLGKHLSAGKKVLLSTVPFFGKCAHRDGGDVPLVDRRPGRSPVGPTHCVSGAKLRRPPCQSIGGEGARPQKGPFEPRFPDRLFDLQMDFGDG